MNMYNKFYTLLGCLIETDVSFFVLSHESNISISLKSDRQCEIFFALKFECQEVLFLFSINIVKKQAQEQKMSSIHQGRVTKKYSVNKAMRLERANFILRNQLKQMGLKIFLREEEIRQCEKYRTYLEETLCKLAYGTWEKEQTVAREEDFITEEEEEEEEEEPRREYAPNPSVMEDQREENEDNWQCFWCLKKKQNEKQDYSKHVKDCCFGKQIFMRCYQNESLKCSKCCGVKIVFEPCENVLSEACVKCSACCNKLPLNKKTLTKHIEKHNEYFSFFCSCKENCAEDSNEKRNEMDETVSSSLSCAKKGEEETYWRCFWCLREHGKNGVVLEDYSTHALKCPTRTFW